MMLVWLLVAPTVGGILAWIAGRWSSTWSRWIALAATAAELLLALALWAGHAGQPVLADRADWMAALNAPWIPDLGIRFHLAIDGLSLLLVLLTGFLGVLSVAASWTDIRERVGFFHFNLLWVLAGVTGVFLAQDLFLFYFFWEMMLVPMYLLIAIWGHERRVYAAAKFFLFTQLSGLLMLVAILGLYFAHASQTGIYTFELAELMGTRMSPTLAVWLMLGFFAAFAVKLPAVPVHTWLPDAHTEAPTAGSVVLAGLMLKTGAYGLLRFAIPLFPTAAAWWAPVAMALGVASVLYGALLAFGQTDLKRLVAYTSVSHMGFVLLGAFVGNELALQGVMLQILCHGVSTGALFILVGALQERTHTRDMGRMQGLWQTAPRMGAATMLFALASMGLPGLGNFLGEFLVLLGTYQVSPPAAIIASLGLITSTVYALWMVQRVFQGPNDHDWRVPDLNAREVAVIAALTVVILWLGLYPQPVMDTFRQSIGGLRRVAGSPSTPAVARAAPAARSGDSR